MSEPRELYHEEITNLKKFKEKIDTHAIYKEDLEGFSDQYEELVAQAKVITRVSDRLQKKLDNANIQIREQNEEIKDKNMELENTVLQLAKARVGRKAALIMMTVGIALFFIEQVFLQDIITEYVSMHFPGYAFLGSIFVLLILFFIIKFLEGALESYFMNQEKKKIMSHENSSKDMKASYAN